MNKINCSFHFYKYYFVNYNRYRVDTRASTFYRCFSILRLRKGGILRSHKSGIIFTRFGVFIWWRKTGMLKCFCNSSGTNIGADTSSQTRSSE